MKKIKIALFLLLLCNSITAQDNKPPFWNDIQNFKKNDSVSFPGRDQILFIGSSSFTMWKNVQEYFPSYPIINRGFGGSVLTDVIRYADDIIFPYNPKQIVIYCGENDVVSSDTITVATVFNRFKTLFEIIRNKLPHVPVIFISLKPSPSRWQSKDKMIAVNQEIKKYLKKKKRTKFVNVWNVMLGPDGRPIPSLFLQDNLHMNKTGYAIWQKALAPYLKK